MESNHAFFMPPKIEGTTFALLGVCMQLSSVWAEEIT